MKTTILVLLVPFFAFCQYHKTKIDQNVRSSGTENINTKDYQLIKPKEDAKAVLVLFGGFPENSDDIKREFKIIDFAKEKDIAVIFMNFNRKLWLEENEKLELAGILQKAFIDNELPINNIYIGGFSSGGNISLLISDFIIGMKQFYVEPKGVFIIDSPIDFLAMYESGKRIIERGNENGAIQEFAWLLKTFKNSFGNPNDSITKFEQYSIYTSKTSSIQNIRHLKNTKIRLYTEPDTTWWKKFGVSYEDMNAYNIKRLSEVLKKEFGEQKVEYIPTENKGYRSDGQRNPHSWSIIDKKDLIDWMLNKN